MCIIFLVNEQSQNLLKYSEVLSRYKRTPKEPASCTVCSSLFLLSINRNLQQEKPTHVLYVLYLILGHQTPNSVQMLPAQTNTAELERLLSTTKCCIPARKAGQSENSPEAPSVIVGLEVDDAETIGKPQWDAVGPNFVWMNTLRNYLVCQSTAACFPLVWTLELLFFFFTGEIRKEARKNKLGLC